MTPIRIVQVGMGGWGRDWAKMLAGRPELVEVAAYVDIAPEMLRLLQQEGGAPAERCFATLDAALAATDAEAVLVTAALGGHVPVAEAALAAGKHVLVEKPFAPSVAEAARLVAQAEAAGLALMVSQNYRFFPAAQAAAALVRGGELGPVGAVSLQFRRDANGREPGHSHFSLRHPLLLDMSIHHFDLMRFVLGQEPTAVSCHAWNPAWSNFAEPAAASATITFDGGAVVSYQGSWVSPASKTLWAGEWQIECAEGVISWTSRDDANTPEGEEVTVRRRGARARRVRLPDMAHWDRAGSMAAFAHAIRSGETPPSSGRENLGSIGLTFAAITSAETGQALAVPR
ncbi:Gfo/Idh/MocA family oxidoreductase [Oscillochloris sp. ZM17-4]|uniref:Gfo/Idh/MocA family protein n=1 Tax=Oscillochloris sp. ZM17-4 TaxID=2866714 RepID=UPI001C72DE07|nr:Gfo/Idh/MocA family oxidoreductase [Oscillochloris sp. ZM17-4]MBX0326326.1 Gfo/Idh/MocA family oxidoreductase [Oscillochloris sp. ZM17-4]